MTIAKRVAARFQKKSMRGVPRGESVEKGKIRIHRYNDSLRVWDLANAGKRGKKVPKLYIAPTYAYEGDVQKWLGNISGALLVYGTFDQAESYIKELQDQFPGEIEMSKSTERGIDVLPGGTKTIELRWTVGKENLNVKATPLDFHLTSSHLFGGEEDPSKGFRQNTLYTPRKRADAKKFYIWLSDKGDRQIQKMDISAIRKLWPKISVQYDYH